MDCSVSETSTTLSVRTVRDNSSNNLHIDIPSAAAASQLSSPRSSALPSPPDSPDSLSSFPSLSSSFFVSSAEHSPPHAPVSDAHHPHPHPDTFTHPNQHHTGTHTRDPTLTATELIIPSLTLPEALRAPTQSGRALGALRLVVLGERAGCAEFLLDENEDVLHVAEPEPYSAGGGASGELGPGLDAALKMRHGAGGGAGARVLRASTDWVERREAGDDDDGVGGGGGEGLDRFEPAHNVEVLEVSTGGPMMGDRLSELTKHLLAVVQRPFRQVHDLLDDASSSPSSPDRHPRPHPHPRRRRRHSLLTDLASSPSTPLYTALVVLSTGPHPLFSTHELRALVATLGAHVPVVLLPPVAGTHTRARLPVSRALPGPGPGPTTPGALRAALFENEETVGRLRAEAAERFLAWYRCEAARVALMSSSSSPSPSREWVREDNKPDCESFERPDDKDEDEDDDSSRPCPSQWTPPPVHCAGAAAHGDPLHLPSLVMYSLTLLGPLRARLAGASLSGPSLGLALFGTFCIGVGVGVGLGMSAVRAD